MGEVVDPRPGEITSWVSANKWAMLGRRQAVVIGHQRLGLGGQVPAKAHNAMARRVRQNCAAAAPARAKREGKAVVEGGEGKPTATGPGQGLVAATPTSTAGSRIKVCGTSRTKGAFDPVG